MSRFIALVALAFVVNPAAQAQEKEKPPELVASTEAQTPEVEKAGFHLPPGFEAQLVASEPAINKPMNIAFDDRGRLWVTSTVEYPYPAKPGTKPRDRVVILDDFAPDGKARKVSTFADGLNIPIGVLPIGRGDSALVHAIPAIRRLTDTDGDGKADRSEEVYSSFGFRDTHGMTNAFTWGFDGWIYACHGFNNESTVKGADGKPIVMQSGNVYRMKPDGSHAEYVTHGQVNPFGLSFDPRGDLYSCDCHSRPIYCLLPGAYYPSFGKPHDGLGFGPEMLQHDHGSTGIAGIVYYTSDHFPASYRDTIFIGNVVTSRINRDTLAWTGASPKATATPDFLSSDDPWFRPVDIKLGPDGALYVADFYNRIIGHYEVPLTHPGRDRERGRIWRIVYTGKDATPLRSGYDGTKLSVADLVRDLGDPNFTRRIKAANQLVDKGPQTSGDLAKAAMTDADATRRVHALWVVHRLDLMNTSTLEKALSDSDPIVRTHVLKIIAERGSRFPAETAMAVNGLNDPDAFVRRASAEALGANPEWNNVQPLIDALHKTPAGDTHLRHVIRMALRDVLKAEPGWATNPSNESDIADVSLGIPGSIAAVHLTAFLQKHPETSAADRIRFIRHIARYANLEYQTVIGSLITMAREPSTRVGMIKAVYEGEQSRGGAVPLDVKTLAHDTATSLMASRNDDEFGLAIDLIGALKLVEFSRPLRQFAEDRSRPAPRRIRAIESLAAMDPKGSVVPFAKVVADASEPERIRERTATLLAAGNQAEARDALLKALPTAPGKLQTVIATGLVQTAPGAEGLLGAIASGKASARLLQERGVEVRLAGLNLANGKARIDALLKGLPPAEAKIQTLIDQRKKIVAGSHPDLARGAEAFTKYCGACHQIDSKGARIGPQLDGVGVRGVDRLLEDVLDPNRNVDQAFRMTSIATKDGQVVSGLLLREEGQVLVLADAQGKDVRVAKDQVEDRTVSQLSPMPANWSEQIPEAEFTNLMGFLLDKKPRN